MYNPLETAQKQQLNSERENLNFERSDLARKKEAVERDVAAAAATTTTTTLTLVPFDESCLNDEVHEDALVPLYGQKQTHPQEVRFSSKY